MPDHVLTSTTGISPGKNLTKSSKSLKALDWVNLFMADVKDGIGIYLSVYLLAEHHWNPEQIGIVMSVPFIFGIVLQPFIGALIDKTVFKRHLLVLGSVAIAFSTVMILVWPLFWPIFSAQLLVGIFQAVYPPAVAAITLGIVGHAQLSQRIGRNESFNHGGNMLAAIINIGMSIYISYKGIFYFSIFQCLLIAVATLMIREKDIDHNLARAAAVSEGKEVSAENIGKLITDRNTLMFIIALFLFNVANGPILPLLGQKISLADQKNAPVYLSFCIIVAQAVMVGVAWLVGRNADKGRKKLFLIAFFILPVRPLLFSIIDQPSLLVGLQVLDGLAAGIYGVIYILMTADLSQGTGRFNLLQGIVYTSLGIGVGLSNYVSGIMARLYGYDRTFQILAAIALLAGLFFLFFVRETRKLESIREVAVN